MKHSTFIVYVVSFSLILTGCTSTIHQAIQSKDYSIVHNELLKGANPYTPYGLTLISPYELAISTGDMKMIDVMINSGHPLPNNAINLAIKSGQTELATEFIQKGSDVNICDDDLSHPYYWKLVFSDSPVMPPLLSAVFRKNYKAIELLADNDALFHGICPEKYRVNALHAASEIGDLHAVKLLISKGAPLNRLLTNDYLTNRTAISLAAEEGHLNVVKALAENGAFISYNEDYPQPIVLADSFGHSEVVSYLSSQGAVLPETYSLGDAVSDAANIVIGTVLVVGAVALVAGAVAVAAEGAKNQTSTRSYLPSESTSSTQTTSSSGCKSDFSCQYGYSCVKAPYSSTGTCLKTVDDMGIPTLEGPSTDSMGVRTDLGCIFDGCPAGFRCDTNLKACVK